MQVFICLAILIVFVTVLIIKYLREQTTRTDIELEDTLTHKTVVDRVTKRLADFMKEDTFSGKDDKDFEINYRRRIRIEEAMTDCV